LIEEYQLQDIKNRLIESQEEARTKMKSQGASRVPYFNQQTDTIETLESLILNPPRIGTVASARNRTVYKKKMHRRSQGTSPQMGICKPLKKNDGFFCLSGNNCLKQSLDTDNFMY
jgi:sigma54-dependent transcription regulator